jgi:hypothetical protein
MGSEGQAIARCYHKEIKFGPRRRERPFLHFCRPFEAPEMILALAWHPQISSWEDLGRQKIKGKKGSLRQILSVYDPTMPQEVVGTDGFPSTIFVLILHTQAK